MKKFLKGQNEMKSLALMLSIFMGGVLVSACGTAVHHGLYVASQVAGWAVPAAGVATSVAGGISSEDDKNAPTVTFAPGIDTEQTVRAVLDKGGEPQSVMVLDSNTPVAKVLFYKRGDFIRPILFTHNKEKDEFVFQGMRALKKKEFKKTKDTPEYRKNCEEWYSAELARRAAQYQRKGSIDLQYKYIQQIEQASPIGARAYNAMAWFHATCPDEKYRDAEKALMFAKKSVFLERAAYNLDTLAAAWAEAGNFGQSVRCQEEAIKICTNEKRKVWLQEHLEAYQGQKTYLQWKEGNEQDLISRHADAVTEAWRGEVTQARFLSYPAEMRLTEVIPGSESGSTIYPTLGCGGTVACIDIQGNKYIFREQIKYGPCVQGGTIHALKTGPGTLYWQWFYPEGRSGSVGTLYISDE